MPSNKRYHTDYGGMVEERDGKLVFIKKPDFPGFEVGDVFPANLDWLLTHANEETLQQLEQAIPDNGPLTDQDIVFIDD